MCTAHHIGICPLNVRPPKTRSGEEVESRQRRLGRIDSFSRGASAEPFPGWRRAGGAAAAGEQRRGPKPTSLGFPAPAEHNGAPLARGRPLFPPLLAAPAASGSRRRRMNESERTQPRSVPGTQPPAPGGRALRREARGSSEARQPRLVPPTPARLSGSVPPHMPRAAAASSHSPQRQPPPAPGGLAPVAACSALTERLPNERS